MAKKKIEQAPAYMNHTCGDCGWGKFTNESSNLDMNGKPICLDCPYTKDRRMIRCERACDRWKPNKSKNGRIAK